MRNLFLIAVLLIHAVACAQAGKSPITVAAVTRIESTLAADSMQGRKAGTPGSEKAAHFIAAEFAKAGLQPLAGSTSFLQPFRMLQAKTVQSNGTADSTAIQPQHLAAISFQPQLQVTETSGYKIKEIKKGENFFRTVRTLTRAKENSVVFVDTSLAEPFGYLAQLQRPIFEKDKAAADSVNLVFVLGSPAKTFSFAITQQVATTIMMNVVGMLPGKNKNAGQVVFSAHYDHLGIGTPEAGDSIYNGANDDAAGTTAVIMLANHFKKEARNARTLLFVAFTAEEIGGFGSQYFSQQLAPDSVAAMFNIEMIGTESKWGKNSAYITGFDKSSMGEILQKALAGSRFQFHPDPYPDQQLFYRSDNATLALLGVPAHTISTSKMDSEPNYHKASDEVKTLDLANMTEIIKAIAESSKTIVAGTATPTRVKEETPR